MDTESRHLMLDITCKYEISKSDIECIKEIIESSFTVVKKVEHHFSPQGETVVFILSESHFTLHTYPEHKYISMDIYICKKDFEFEEVIEKIKSIVKIDRLKVKVIQRGKIVEEKRNLKFKFILLLSVLVAFCSIVYEFLIAQSMSTVMGNTGLRYNLTIGVYIASMGLGALLFNKIFKKNIIESFVSLEILLSVVGGLSPILVLSLEFLHNRMALYLNVSFNNWWMQTSFFTFSHLIIVVVGFLSGLELPLLIEMGKKILNKENYSVLAFDYLGTLIGAICFPLIIIPNFHLFSIGYFVSLLNLLSGLLVLYIFKIKSKGKILISLFFILIWAGALATSSELNQKIINYLYFYKSVFK